MDDGYEFFADRKLVTIFSAPNYCGEFDNDGAMLTVDEDLCCSFVKLCPDDKIIRDFHISKDDVFFAVFQLNG